MSVYHPPTLEERARRMQLRERQNLLYRLAFAFIVVVPTLIIGIVYMTGGRTRADDGKRRKPHKLFRHCRLLDNVPVSRSPN